MLVNNIGNLVCFNLFLNYALAVLIREQWVLEFILFDFYWLILSVEI